MTDDEARGLFEKHFFNASSYRHPQYLGYTGTYHGKWIGFLAGIEAVQAENEALRRDKVLLDSGVILMRGRDEFGVEYTVLHKGVNLRNAIELAISEEGMET